MVVVVGGSIEGTTEKIWGSRESAFIIRQEWRSRIEEVVG